MPIAPDEKDWTWVLERTCPECGFTAAAFDRADVGDMIRDNAASWRAVLERPDVARRPSPDRWSPLEYACHVRDVFRIYDGRLALMLTEDDPDYPNWDQDASAADDRYHEQVPARVADDLARAGRLLAERFDSVTGDEWLRTGNRSDGKRFTIESFARYMIHDPIHHLHDVG